MLANGKDSPSLRVLAGEDPANWQDVERYFRLVCRELKVKILTDDDGPREVANWVHKLYRLGEFSPKQTLGMMSMLYERSDCSDPLLSLWFRVQDEFFPEPLDYLKEWIDEEWEIFDAARDLEIPPEFYILCRCSRCGQFAPRPKSSFYRDFAVWRDFAPVAQVELASCRRCGDTHLLHMGFPEVQEDYFERLRKVSRYSGLRRKLGLWLDGVKH